MRDRNGTEDTEHPADSAPPCTKDERPVPLTEERRSLVESVTGYAEALAVTMAEDVGLRWLRDLQAAAMLGATLAARSYDFNAQASFPTYAWSFIFGSMIDMLRRERVRVPPEMAEALERAAAAIDIGRDYAAQVHDSGADEPREQTANAAGTVALALLCLGTGERHAEALLLREERRALVRRSIAHLADRERTLIHLRYFEGLTLKEIAAHFGVHEDTVGAWHKTAIKRLAGRLRTVLLQE